MGTASNSTKGNLKLMLNNLERASRSAFVEFEAVSIEFDKTDLELNGIIRNGISLFRAMIGYTNIQEISMITNLSLMMEIIAG